jgi:RNA polymerase sigma factor (sigma-70 family)
VEVTALKPGVAPGLKGASPLLRLQPDERLIALTRRGQHAAFETLFSRYHSRLLSFCRHMLGSREDAEDVLQEVFAAAFNAVLADDRPINVRPWLYRIARNRSLNHLRRASAIGVDSMDIHFAEHGLSTGDQVLRREGFRQLIGDVQQLPETQRTALLLREIDALSYEQIAVAMETTVPSVKSLLVRARISLAEAAEARKLSCGEVRSELGEVAEGLVKISPPARRHLRDCERCRTFRKLLKDNNHALAAIFPAGPLLLLKHLVLGKFGASSAAGHAAGAGSAGAGVSAASGATSGAGAASAAGGLLTAGAGAGAVGGTSAAGGLVTAGAGAIATKAAATLAAAALVTAGAVAVSPSHVRRRHTASSAVASADPVAATHSPAPLVVRSVPQPISSGVHVAVAASAAQLTARRPHHRPLLKSQSGTGAAGGRLHPHTPTDATILPAVVKPAVTPPVAQPPATPPPPAVVQVTTETTALPSTGTAPTPPQPAVADPPVTSTTPPTPAPPVETAPTTTEPAVPAAGESAESEPSSAGETGVTTAPNPVEAATGGTTGP